MKRIWMMTAALLLAITPAATEAGEKIENPEYASWKAFKAGTKITMRTTTTAATVSTKLETTTTLKSKGKDKLVLSTQTVTFVDIPGQGEKRIESPAQDREVPAQLEMPNMPEGVPGTPKPEVKEGEETLKILGKSYKCKWIETKIKLGETTTTSKVWSSTEVPGGMVKMTSSTKGQIATSMESVLAELKVP
ncbi:MAG: hypothetical protein QNJ98_05795 [Planctomycetota bacterium]|nr:hypothetical protein [Planctomycetota bacterium]